MSLMSLPRRHFLAGLTAGAVGVPVGAFGAAAGHSEVARPTDPGVASDWASRAPRPAPQWPGRLTVGDRARAAQLEKLRELVRHWETTMAEAGPRKAWSPAS